MSFARALASSSRAVSRVSAASTCSSAPSSAAAAGPSWLGATRSASTTTASSSTGRATVLSSDPLATSYSRRLPGFAPVEPASSSSTSSPTSDFSSASTPLLLTTSSDPLAANYISSETPHSPEALLASQPDKYLVAKLYTGKYLLHPKDILTIARLKPAPPLGAKLKLTRVFEVGSRDFALKAPQEGGRLTEVECHLTVLEHTASPVVTVIKKKRRKGYQRHIDSRQLYTRLRVGDIVVRGSGVEKDDELPKERQLTRPPTRPFDGYASTDMSREARVARRWGIVRRPSEELVTAGKAFKGLSEEMVQPMREQREWAEEKLEDLRKEKEPFVAHIREAKEESKAKRAAAKADADVDA